MNTLSRVRIRILAEVVCRPSVSYTVEDVLSVSGQVEITRSYEVIGTGDERWTSEMGYIASIPEESKEIGCKCWVSASLVRQVSGFLGTETCQFSSSVAYAFEVLDSVRLYTRISEEYASEELVPAGYTFTSPVGWSGAYDRQFFIGDDPLVLTGCADNPEDPEDPNGSDVEPEPPTEEHPPANPNPDPGPDLGGIGQGNLPAARQFVTCLANMVTEDGASRAIAGTRGRLYVDGGDGGWQMVLAIPDLCGNQGIEETEVPYGRFLVDVIGNTLFIAHIEAGFWTWSPGNPFTQDENGIYHSAEPVDDLIALGISEARAVCVSNGFVLIGNYVEEGVRKSGSIIVSDYNAPRIYVPGGNSISTVIELGDEVQILSIRRLGDGVRVLTTRDIWVGVMVGDVEVWRFVRLEDVSPADALAYPFSVVSTGSELVYLANDGIVVLEKTDSVPARPVWMQLAGAAAFNGIRPKTLDGLEEGLGIAERCKIAADRPWLVTGGFDAKRRTVLFFWASEGGSVPDTGLAFDLRTGAASLLDFGATAVCPIKPTIRTTYRRWLASQGLCDPKPDINEGDPLPVTFVPTTAQYLVHPDELTGMFPDFDLRNVNLEQDFPNSWYVMARARGECCATCPPVTAEIDTVLGDPLDKCLKVITDGYFAREVVTNTVSPTWADEGAEDGQTISDQTPPVGSEWPPNHPVSVLGEGDVSTLFYGWMWQSDVSDRGSPLLKELSDIQVAYDSRLDEACVSPGSLGVDPTAEWTLWCQAAGGWTPGGMRWHDDDPQPVHHHVEIAEPDDVASFDGGPGPMTFRFCSAGVYLAFRIGGGGYREDGPQLGPLSISSVTLFVDGASLQW